MSLMKKMWITGIGHDAEPLGIIRLLNLDRAGRGKHPRANRLSSEGRKRVHILDF